MASSWRSACERVVRRLRGYWIRVRQRAAHLPPGSRHRLTCRTKKSLGAARVRESACLALVFGIDCLVADRQSDSRPARIAVVTRGGGSKHEHKAPDAHCGIFSVPAPGTSVRRTGIALGLIFLSVIIPVQALFALETRIPVQAHLVLEKAGCRKPAPLGTGEFREDGRPLCG
jgi:hypothetical protein